MRQTYKLVLAHLRVLTKNLDFVVFCELEISQVVADRVHRLYPRSRINILLVLLFPLMYLLNKLVEVRFTGDEILFPVFLYGY